MKTIITMVPPYSIVIINRDTRGMLTFINIKASAHDMYTI
jgi:hypothetical protein